jgi:hypothetical protein
MEEPMSEIQFQVDEFVILTDPTGQTRLVSFHGTAGSSAILWDSHTQFAAPLTWLKHHSLYIAAAEAARAGMEYVWVLQDTDDGGDWLALHSWLDTMKPTLTTTFEYVPDHYAIRKLDTESNQSTWWALMGGEA